MLLPVNSDQFNHLKFMKPTFNLPYVSVYVFVLLTANDINSTLVQGRYVSVHKTRTEAVDAASKLPYPTFIQEEMLEDVYNTRQVMESTYGH